MIACQAEAGRASDCIGHIFCCKPVWSAGLIAKNREGGGKKAQSHCTAVLFVMACLRIAIQAWFLLHAILTFGDFGRLDIQRGMDESICVLDLHKVPVREVPTPEFWRRFRYGQVEEENRPSSYEVRWVLVYLLGQWRHKSYYLHGR